MTALWRAQLVDNAGLFVAAIPSAAIRPITRPAMNVDATEVTLDIASPAGWAVVSAVSLPLLELQVYRGTRCVFWGPLVAAPTDFDDGTVQVTAHGAPRHLDRTLTGPPDMPNLAPNPTFTSDLSGWDSFLTDLVPLGDGAIVSFASASAHIEWAQSGVTGTPNAALQLYHDEIVTASDLAPTRCTIRACWWIPPGQVFGPPDPGNDGRTNLDHAMLATIHDPAGEFDMPTPVGYFQLSSVLSVTRWGDIFAGEYQDIECSVDIPQGTGEWRVHLSMSPPRLVAYVTLVEITIDRPLELDGTVTGRLGDLIEHAQDPTFDHVDRLIVGDLEGSTSTVVDEEAIMESDRRPVLGAFDQAGSAGQIEWRTRYTATGRTIQYGIPPLGAQLDYPVTVTDDGRSGYVASAKLNRRSPFTVVTGQSSQGQVRSDTAAVTASDELAWEEVFVAPQWVPRWGLAAWTANRLAEDSQPDTLDLTINPAHPGATVWLDGTIDLLDRVPVTFDRDGITLTGWWQVRRMVHNPQTDGLEVTLVPDVT
jgi:hypothetical protein